ncbi:MAG: hydroxyacid dehydrogenase [Chthoniobacteraceae bacterium]|nr:hydroxyacid dehydrogenase [Chthoniobacteraceae bacterium]
MNVAVFSTKRYDREFLEKAAGSRHRLRFYAPKLDLSTASLVAGCEGICVFVNDCLDEPVLAQLAQLGVKLVALRCAGFNNVDLAAAQRHGLTVARVPAYSPFAVAEHAVAMILALNRKIYRAYNRVREGNFALDGLLGFDLHGRTVGLIGTGKIGAVFARIMTGFGCRIVAFDPFENKECLELGVAYERLDSVLEQSDVISLHCPLTPENHHLINAAAIAGMKEGVMLINTSRGALIDTVAVVDALKRGRIGALGLDVYEEENELFFEDLSGRVLQDDVFMRLLTFPNVLITGHQAFFTREALEGIAATTMSSISEFEEFGTCANRVVQAS